jgi:predicted DNA-binding transcriptional regulator YafY
VQRRLNELAAQGKVEKYDPDDTDISGPPPPSPDARTDYYRIVEGALGLPTAPGMTAGQALALQSLRRFGSKLIPRHVMTEMGGFFSVAERHLQSLPPQRKFEKRWPAKVDVVGDTFQLIRPPVSDSILEAVSEALFRERALEVVYRSRHRERKGESPQEKKILPLALVQHRDCLYLVADALRQTTRLRTQYRLDRMERAAMSIESFDYPSDFTLEDYIRKDKEFDYQVQPEVTLKLRFTNGAGDPLRESKIHVDQEIELESVGNGKRSSEVMTVRAKASPSLKLLWWLRSFGADVEVLEPPALREAMAAESRRLTALYK